MEQIANQNHAQCTRHCGTWMVSSKRHPEQEQIIQNVKTQKETHRYDMHACQQQPLSVVK